ncbi:MAG: 5-oxoprolinase subunit PxpA [Polyangiaceae bacterium]
MDLNIDLGELADEPTELFSIALSVNIACGGHAGDAASMRHAIEMAVASGANIAAHPSYPDRDGFGRRARFTATDQTAASVAEQCAALFAIGAGCGARIERLKLHGALYHDASVDSDLARVVLEAASRGLLHLRFVVGPAHSALEREAARVGLDFLREGFADRGYTEDGRLVPRAEPGALLASPEACALQAAELARSDRFDTLCVHGDTPGAVENARAVRRILEELGLVQR